MHKPAHGRHAKEEKLAVDTSNVVLLNISACYTRQLIQLEKCHNFSLAERFFARLCSKHAIAREGTVYPSNQGPRGVIVLG